MGGEGKEIRNQDRVTEAPNLNVLQRLLVENVYFWGRLGGSVG